MRTRIEVDSGAMMGAQGSNRINRANGGKNNEGSYAGREYVTNVFGQQKYAAASLSSLGPGLAHILPHCFFVSYPLAT